MDIEVKQLSVTFPSPMGAVRVLRDVNLLFHGGKITALVGESGSGKSILGTAIMRLLPENARMTGSIFYDGNDLLRFSEKEMNEIRGDRIGWIAQDPISAMDPLMRVGRQVTEVLRKRLGWGKEKSRENALVQMEKYGLGDPVRVCASYPHQLSGGMCQRVMIAMAMSCEPELLIADEPTTALDVTIQAQILELMEDIRAKKNTGILMITHDLGVVAEMCSRVVVMYAGRIVEEAPVQELFADPKHPYTQGLIGSVPKLGSGVESLPSIPGSVPDLSVMPKGCKFAPRCKYAMDICHQQEPELADINEAGTRKCRCHLLNKTGKEA